jgi:D-alanyl-D-alanine carboxypeptidase/D-alanyl-D-alanine-endopeptidase (penicillin-binding protein 4)
VPDGEQHHAGSARSRVAAALLVVVLLLGAAGGVLWWRGDLDSLFGPSRSPSAAAPDVPAPEGVDLPEPRAARPVLEEPSGGRVSATELRRRIGPLLRRTRLGRRVGVAVHDLTNDQPVLQVGDGAYLPASTLKLLTAAGVLELLGPTHRFETRVTLTGAERAVPTVTLVGGGDPMLTARPEVGGYPRAATLRALVRQTSRALGEAGIRRVRIGFDDTLFTGPAVSPAWEPTYVPDITSPVSALLVDEGIDPATSARSRAPAALAARTFADGVRGPGLEVVAVADQPVPAPPGAVELAAVQSPPLARVVEHVLGLSDNEGAEVLLRHAGLAAGTGGSFAGGARAVEQALIPLGVPWASVRLYDGSGLSRDNRLPLQTLVAVLRLAADDERPELRPVLSGLPVAGFDGTLVDRFYAEGTREALGLVRAKTGTLTGAHALAGTVVDADGVQLAFVAIANGVLVRDTLFARDELDRLAAALAGCGCAR